MHKGESIGTASSTLSAGSRHRQLARLPHLRPRPRLADDRSRAATLLHQNQSFARGARHPGGGPNIYPVDVHPGLTLHEVAERVDGLPGTSTGEFAKVAASGAVHSVFSPPGSDNLEGLLGTGNYLVLPGESDTTLLTAMVHTLRHARPRTAGSEHEPRPPHSG